MKLYLSIPKLQRCNRWRLGREMWFHPILYNGCSYLSMLGLKLIHVSKGCFIIFQPSVYLANGMQWDAMNLNMPYICAWYLFFNSIKYVVIRSVQNKTRPCVKLMHREAIGLSLCKVLLSALAQCFCFVCFDQVHGWMFSVYMLMHL